jgi:hypothetical protein
MKGRPGGNPDFGMKYTLTTDRAEPLLETFTIRLPKSTKARLKQMEDAQEFVREAIAEKLAQLESQLEQQAS